MFPPFCRFNKQEEDFPSLREYNDYLEEVEDMSMRRFIFFCTFICLTCWLIGFGYLLEVACNLIEGIDVTAIEAKIAKYQEENAEQIVNSRARKVF